MTELLSSEALKSQSYLPSFNLVYLIDDDLIFHAITKRLIGLFDFAKETESFHNGEAAIRALSQRIARKELLPEIIFLDLNMPIMDGWEFLAAFKHLPKIEKPISIYIVTSSDLPSDREKYEAFTNLKGYIIKPVSEADFKAIWAQKFGPGSEGTQE